MKNPLWLTALVRVVPMVALVPGCWWALDPQPVVVAPPPPPPPQYAPPPPAQPMPPPVAEAPPPEVAAAPVVVADESTIYPTMPPPDPIPEIRPLAPAYGYAWIDGYWDWTGVDWTWNSGYWMPQRAGVVYIAPRFVFVDGRPVYYRSYWARSEWAAGVRLRSAGRTARCVARATVGGSCLARRAQRRLAFQPRRDEVSRDRRSRRPARGAMRPGEPRGNFQRPGQPAGGNFQRPGQPNGNFQHAGQARGRQLPAPGSACAAAAPNPYHAGGQPPTGAANRASMPPSGGAANRARTPPAGAPRRVRRPPLAPAPSGGGRKK